jgi:hypothetical protein
MANSRHQEGQPHDHDGSSNDRAARNRETKKSYNGMVEMHMTKFRWSTSSPQHNDAKHHDELILKVLAFVELLHACGKMFFLKFEFLDFFSKPFIIQSQLIINMNALYGNFPLVVVVGVLDPTAHPGLPLEVLFGVGRCYRL